MVLPGGYSCDYSANPNALKDPQSLDCIYLKQNNLATKF